MEKTISDTEYEKSIRYTPKNPKGFGKRPENYVLSDVGGLYDYLDEVKETFEWLRSECIDHFLPWIESNHKLPKKPSLRGRAVEILREKRPDFPLTHIAKPAGLSALSILSGNYKESEIDYITLTGGVEHAFGYNPSIDGFGPVSSDRPIRFVRRYCQKWVLKKQGDKWLMSC